LEASRDLVFAEITLRLTLSIGAGLLIGLEREWSHKDLGARTFAIAGLFGALSSLLGASFAFAFASLAAVSLIVALINIRNIVRSQNLEITTSLSLLVTLTNGILIGDGYLLAPVASAIFLTLLLSVKAELSTFAGGLRLEEIRSAVLIGLLGS
jgi:uncharacterized membrane protein (DUF4010 family)